MVYKIVGNQLNIVGNKNSQPMLQCHHEEADTCVLDHLLHVLQISSRGMVFAGKTDVIVIIGYFSPHQGSELSRRKLDIF